jgi:hypothetical protein
VGENVGCGRRGLGEQDAELVAAEAGDEILVRAETRPQPVGDGAQQHIARRVAEAVIDRLEVVEIEEHHRRRVAAMQLVADAGEEVGAVGHTGERVVIGAITELALQRAVGRDVTQRQHDSGDSDVRCQIDRRELHRPMPAIDMWCRDFQSDRGVGGQLP